MSDASQDNRLEALHRYDILDTEPEEAFDRLTRLGVQLFDVDVAFVAFVTDERQWFKSTVGLSKDETSLAVSFCDYAIEDAAPLVVDDATEDERFADNPFVTDDGYRFYAGAPLVTPNGFAIGTYVIMDKEPRRLTGADTQQLTSLADMAMDELELRQKTRDRIRAETALRKTKTRLQKTLESLSDAVFVVENGRQIVACNKAAERIFGYDRDELIGETTECLHVDEDAYQQFGEITERVLTEKGTYTGEHRMRRRDGTEIITEHSIAHLNPEKDDNTVVSIVRDITEQRLAQQQLREKSNRLHAITENVADGIFRTDAASGEVIYANSSLVQMFGFDDLQALRKVEPSSLYVNPSRRQEVFDMLKETGSCKGLEVEYRRRDGSTFVGLVNSTVAYDERGEPRYHDGAITDITPQKEALRALRTRERQLRGLASSIPGVLYKLYGDPHDTWKILYASDQTRTLLDLDPNAEDLFEKLLVRIPTSHRESFIQSIRQAAEERRPKRVEFPYEVGPDEYRWFLAASHPELAGGGDAVIFNGVLLDITDRKAAERDRKILSAAVEQTGEAVLITEAAPLEAPGPPVIYANRAFEALTGYNRDAIIGHSPAILFGPETDEEVLSRLLSTLKRGEPFEGEAVMYTRNDEPLLVHWTVAPVRSESGAIEYWVSVQRDVTEDRQREAALREARDEAEEANRLKSALLANMSHEIRTPLTSMIGYSELLGEMDLSDDAAEFVGFIQRSSDRLLRTLTSVLDLSQLEAGTLTLHPEEFDLRELTNDVLASFRGTAEEAGVELKAELPASPVKAVLDEAATHRILSNLLSNAIKFTPGGGAASIRLEVTDDRLCFEVEDTGIGIDPDFMPNLFMPYKQESTGLARDYEGAGLGLTIVSRITQELDGHVEAQSEKGVGSTFTVQLPRNLKADK